MVAQILDSGGVLAERIAKQTGKPAEEIKKLVEKRQAEYGGLLTEAGAAYSIAKDLNVETGFEREFKIGELADGMQAVDIKATVKRAFPTHEFERNGRKSNVTNVIISDETGEINLALWGQDKNLLEKIAPNSKIAVKNGYTKKKDKLELHAGERSKIILTS